MDSVEDAQQRFNANAGEACRELMQQMLDTAASLYDMELKKMKSEIMAKLDDFVNIL
jgi:hypothetical protein